MKKISEKTDLGLLKAALIVWIIVIAGYFLFLHQDQTEKIDPEIQPEKNLGEHISEFREIKNNYKNNIPIKDIEKYYDLIGPKAMLDVVEEDNYCHNKSHNIGKVVYERTNRNIHDALEICDRRCSSGCFHGILMGMFSELEIEDEFHSHSQEEDQSEPHSHIEITSENRDQVKEKLLGVCRDEEVSKLFGIGNCVHGVGHAIMFLSSYNIEEAINLCEIYDDIGLQYYCATGVYMERNLVFEDQDNIRGAFYPCDTYTDFPAACYRYEMQDLRKNDYKTIANACLSLNNTEQQRGCMHGLGFGFYSIVRERPETLQFLCRFGDMTAKKMCIEGAVGKTVVFNREEGEESCEYLKGELKETCIASTLDGNFGMSKDFNNYYSKNTPSEIKNVEIDLINDPTEKIILRSKVTYTDEGFKPKQIRIEAGQMVTFKNESSMGMWIGSDNHPTHDNYPEKSNYDCLGSSFDSCKDLSPSDSWAFTFNQKGIWGYHNHSNPNHTGTIVVY